MAFAEILGLQQRPFLFDQKALYWSSATTLHEQFGQHPFTGIFRGASFSSRRPILLAMLLKVRSLAHQLRVLMVSCLPALRSANGNADVRPIWLRRD
jgi:hypothetical protein